MKKQDCVCKSRNGDVSDCSCYTEPSSLLYQNPPVTCQKTIASGSGANPSKY